MVDRLALLLAINYEKASQFKEALLSAKKALELAQAKGDATLRDMAEEKVNSLQHRGQ